MDESGNLEGSELTKGEEGSDSVFEPKVVQLKRPKVKSSKVQSTTQSQSKDSKGVKSKIREMNIPAEFYRTKKGNTCLKDPAGYLYEKNRSGAGLGGSRMFWRCQKYRQEKCKA